MRADRRTQKRFVIVAVVLVLLVVVTGLIVPKHHRTSRGTAIHPHVTTKQPSAPVVTLDTSASVEASVTPRSIEMVDGKLPVARLPFAVAPHLRFVGWFSGPVTDTAATLIDNTMLSQIATDTSTTLYARFEPRPTGVDTTVHGLPILMYHDFYDPSKGEVSASVNMLNLNSFSEQLDYLRQKNYYYPSWEEVYAYVKGEIRLPDKSVVLTSDDGRPDVFEKAYPLLKRDKALMTSFVIGDLALQNKLDLSHIDPAYLDVRSHTFGLHHRESVAAGGALGHAGFAEIQADADKESLVIPQRFVMAYPYGHQGLDFNSATEAAMQKLGFDLAVSTTHGLVYPGQDPLALPRQAVGEPTTLKRFIALLEGK